MAEKILYKAAPRGYISVIMNFKNLRFMTLIKENCLISDLIHEAERTFAKLCSVKFTIKTLKNSVNAVLPHWYPVAPLIRNRDEIFAFADDAAEAMNIDLTKHGEDSTTVLCNSTSPLGSGIMPDSGFTSPTIKLGTAMDSEEPTEMDVEGKERKVGKKKADENLSQDELLSEVFSLKDHNQNRPRQNNAQGKVYIGSGNKNGESCKENNTDNEKDSSLKVDKDKVETKRSSGKPQAENVEETVHLPRNEMTDKSQNKQELVVSKNTQKKEVEKSKEKTAESDSSSSSESSDESGWESSEAKKMKKTSPQDAGKAESESSDDLSESSDDESVHETQEAKSKPEVEDKMSANDLKEKEKLDGENKDDTKKLETKSKISETEKGQSSDSSSSSDDDTDEEEAPTKNNHLEKSKVVDITMGNTTMESENIKESSGKKREASERGSVSSSLSFSSWSSDDDDKEAKTTETKNVEHKDKSQTADADNNNDTANKTKKAATPARKGEGEGKTKKKKGKRKDGLNNDDDDEQINVSAPPSPAKSVCHRKRKEIVLASPAKSVGYKKSVEISFASLAKSVSREKKSASSKTKADLTQTDKDQDEAESESSVSSLKAPFTQLPAKDKVNGSDHEESSDEEHAVKKGKDGKKGKHNADKNTGHVATSADQIESNDPDTNRTKGKKSTRKSAVMLSTSKVASWLLSNPMSGNAAEEISDEARLTQKTKKNKAKDNITSEAQATDKEITVQTDLSDETRKNNKSIVNKTVGDTTMLSPKQKTPSQKRKVQEENEEEQSNNTKKQKKKKTEENKKQIDKKTEANQDKLSFKTPVTAKKVKNTSLLLPKTSKGLSALVEDESDYSVKIAKKSKKGKFAPPTITRLKQTGFLTPSNNTQRKAPETKTSKSRIKRTPASQPNKTIKMNKKEKEFLDNSVVNLETLLNDQTIKW